MSLPARLPSEGVSLRLYPRQRQRERSAQQQAPVTSERLQQLQDQLQLKRAERLRLAARRRTERLSQRHLTAASAAPLAAEVRSAPAVVGYRSAHDGVHQRRARSEICARLAGQTPIIRASTIQTGSNVAS